MQGVIELPFSLGWFLIGAVIVVMGILIVASTIWYAGKSRQSMQRPGKKGFQSIMFMKSSGAFVALIVFAMMALGISAFLGYHYVTYQPIFNDYKWNLLAVASVAIILGTMAAFAIALLNFYSQSEKGGYG